MSDKESDLEKANASGCKIQWTQRAVSWLVCLFLAVVTCVAFAGIRNSSFIVLDDGNYVVDHPPVQHGISWSSVKWAFSTFDCSNWHPLTWLSHILDFQFYHLDPTGHHLTNLAFHVANTVLLFLLLEGLTSRRWSSAFVALLFGIHPMHVESVAWISERKDVLSAFFFLLTLLAYARYAQLQPHPGGEPGQNKSQSRWFAYGLALLFFALGLMSKPMLVTLPFLLFLLDYWPLKRFSALAAPNHSDGGSTLLPRQSAATAGQCLRTEAKSVQLLLVEKIPFFVLSGASGYITWLAQTAGGAVKAGSEYPLAERLFHVPVSYAWYTLKLFWPSDLSIIQPFRGATAFCVAGAIILLLAVTFLALGAARRYPFFIVGWLWFLGMLVPVIGLVQVGNQAYADRYTYLPYIGLFIVVAWSIPELLVRMPWRLLILGAGFVLVAVACFRQTIREVGYWKDGVTLFGRAVTLDPRNDFAWAMLGSEYSWRRNDAKAIGCMHRALKLNPHLAPTWHYLGRILARDGNLPGAEQAFRASLENMSLADDRIDLYNSLGNVLADEGKHNEAAAAYQSSLELFPNQLAIQTKLGRLFFQEKQYDKAAAAFGNAIRIKPDDGEAHFFLGLVFQAENRDSDAVLNYRKAVELNPNSLAALNNLAWLLAADADPGVRNGPEAVLFAQRACQLTGFQNAQLIGTLAAAYAEAGRFDNAAAAAQKAHDVAIAAGQKDLAARNAQLMDLYKSHKAFHMDSTNQ